MTPPVPGGMESSAHGGPVEQCLDGLGLEPVDGVATCPSCHGPRLLVYGLTCSDGCTAQEVADAIDSLARITPTAGLRSLATAMATGIRSRGDQSTHTKVATNR